jgi:predicted DNA-binding transcriptional regulator AlpA
MDLRAVELRDWRSYRHARFEFPKATKRKNVIGVFPKPVPLGPRAVGWLESDVSEWIAGRVKIARDGGRQAA